jgi:hypothetical protein
MYLSLTFQAGHHSPFGGLALIALPEVVEAAFPPPLHLSHISAAELTRFLHLHHRLVVL